MTPLTLTVGAFQCIWYQMDGVDSDKCGPFASIGCPLFVFRPLNTQLLLPFHSDGNTAAANTIQKRTALFYQKICLIKQRGLHRHPLPHPYSALIASSSASPFSLTRT